LRVSVVDTEEEFRALRESWNILTNAASGAIFLQHEWFDAAWAWRKDDASLFVLLAWDGKSLTGVFPLIRVREKRGLVTIRRLELLTVPDTQFCDLIAAPENRGRVTAAFCVELDRRRSQWDLLLLRYLDENAVALHALRAGLSERRYTCEVQTQDRNLFVSLANSWDSYYTTRSRSLKKANNLASNRLKKAGAVTIEWLTGPTIGEPALEDALEKAIDISRRSWKQGTGNSLDRQGPGAFIKTLTAHAARRGWLSLWLLNLDGKPVAMEYQLVDGANVYALRADFDSACEEISPGSHLMRTLLESLFGRSLQRYYMGPGQNAYKTRWTEEGETLQQLSAFSRTWRGRFVHIVEEVLRPRAGAARSALAGMKTPRAVTPSE
jgi:CelD/BcsL family acetyltransferase involved in cellulose biosynthesis